MFMKVLQVNAVFGKGSTGKIVADLHAEFLKNGVDSVVCYGRGQDVKLPHVYKVCPEWYSKLNNLWSRITGVMYGGLHFSTHKLIQIIEKEKPDIVHLQCINGYFVNIYKLIRYLNIHHISTVLTLHAEFMYTASCGHSMKCEKWKSGCGNCPRYRQETRSYIIDGTHKSWLLMKEAFDGFGQNLIVTSVSPWLEKRAREAPILRKANHVTVMNGLNTDIFCRYINNDIYDKFRIPISSYEKIVFHATPLFSLDNPIKGGRYICELAKLMPDTLFIVAGTYASDLIVPNNVFLLGKISNQEDLAKFYSAADVTVITSFRETFSMVTAESLCCGTPVVGFMAGGPESIAVPEYSKFVNFGEVNQLQVVLQDFLSRSWNKTLIAEIAKQYYDRSVMTKEFLNIYNKLYHANKTQ